ncbi:hypothetical protein ABT247_32890, partial [Kitasatospora sp. NPDC001539]
MQVRGRFGAIGERGRTAEPAPSALPAAVRAAGAGRSRAVQWLDGRGGIALEAHQQNSIVLLDA